MIQFFRGTRRNLPAVLSVCQSEDWISEDHHVLFRACGCISSQQRLTVGSAWHHGKHTKGALDAVPCGRLFTETPVEGPSRNIMISGEGAPLPKMCDDCGHPHTRLF